MNKIVLFALLCCLFNNNVVFCKYPYLYSFTMDNTFQLINIETNQLILNQTMPSADTFSINKIIQESDNGDGFILFVETEKKECMYFDYNFQSNQITQSPNKTGFIKLDESYEDINQQYQYLDNNVYIAAHIENILHEKIPSIINWDFNKQKMSVISLKDSLYAEQVMPYSTIDYNNKIYIYLYYQTSGLPVVQTFNIGSNGNANNDFKMYSVKNDSYTMVGAVSSMYYTSYGNTIIVSNIYGLSICELDLTQGECIFKFSVPVGSYLNNFANYFLSADNSKLIHMDGVVENSDYIEFTTIDLSSYSIVNTIKLTNFYQNCTVEAYFFHL